MAGKEAYECSVCSQVLTFTESEYQAIIREDPEPMCKNCQTKERKAGGGQ